MSKNSAVDTTAAVDLSAEITLSVALLRLYYSMVFQKNHAITFVKILSEAVMEGAAREQVCIRGSLMRHI